MFRRLTLGALLLSLILPVLAQSPGTYAAFPGELDWKNVSSEHFKIHYHTPDPVLAGQTLKFAEESLYEIKYLLDYKPKAKYELFLYMSVDDYVHSNQYEESFFKVQGKSPIVFNQGVVIYPNSTGEFRNTVKTEVCKLFLKDFYHGISIRSSIQNSVLLHLPPWYLEGFSSYIGEGWTFEDELWLAGQENADVLTYTLEDEGPMHHTLRKSVWYFISEEFGEEKLAEIFYMTRITHSVEKAFERVWGVGLDNLTNRWREFIQRRILQNQEYRDDPRNFGDLLTLPAKARLISYALHPEEQKIAAYLEKEGQQFVSIYDHKTSEWSETGISGGFKTRQYEPYQYQVPMAWSHDGKYLLTVVNRKKSQVFALWDAGSGRKTYFAFKPVLDRVMHLSWSHDNNQVVCSAFQKGAINLFTFKPGASSFKPITDDLYDDLYPVFTQDDRGIIFATNRSADTLSPAENHYTLYKQPLDLYLIDLQTSEIKPITNTPTINETQSLPVSSFEVLYLTDEVGINGLRKKNLFIDEGTLQTNFQVGIDRFGLNDSLACFALAGASGTELLIAPVQEGAFQGVSLTERNLPQI